MVQKERCAEWAPAWNFTHASKIQRMELDRKMLHPELCVYIFTPASEISAPGPTTKQPSLIHQWTQARDNGLHTTVNTEIMSALTLFPQSLFLLNTQTVFVRILYLIRHMNT